MITAKQCSDRWVEGSGTAKVDYEAYARSSMNWAKGWEAVAAMANQAEKPVVPRMIHEAFWKQYFQWADGLEKVLKSEQVDDLKIVLRMEEEYQAACTRLDGLMNQWMGSSVQGKPTWQDKAKQAAIPARK